MTVKTSALGIVAIDSKGDHDIHHPKEAILASHEKADEANGVSCPMP